MKKPLFFKRRIKEYIQKNGVKIYILSVRKRCWLFFSEEYVVQEISCDFSDKYVYFLLEKRFSYDDCRIYFSDIQSAKKNV